MVIRLGARPAGLTLVEKEQDGCGTTTYSDVRFVPCSVNFGFDEGIRGIRNPGNRNPDPGSRFLNPRDALYGLLKPPDFFLHLDRHLAEIISQYGTWT